jgi:hypothetical protein
MTPITATTEVERPQEEVFSYVTDPCGSASGRRTSSAAIWTATVPPAWARSA